MLHLDEVLTEYRQYLSGRGYYSSTVTRRSGRVRLTCLDCGGLDAMLALQFHQIPFRGYASTTQSNYRGAIAHFRFWYTHIRGAEVLKPEVS